MKVNLVLTPTGMGSHVELDGQNYAENIRALWLDSEAGNTTRLVLELVMREHTTVNGEMLVEVSDSTCRLLRALGWTPPSDLKETPR